MKIKAKKFETRQEARLHTEKARENGQHFETKKFAWKRKFQFFSGTDCDWLLTIS